MALNEGHAKLAKEGDGNLKTYYLPDRRALKQIKRSEANMLPENAQSPPNLRSPMTTNRFQRTRDDHSRERAEDYVELIDALIQEKGEARSVDLAERLGISHVSVGRTLQRLKRDGYVTMEPYRSIFLTDRGKDLASAARDRHTLVLRFLTAIGVTEDVADTDAEGIEHHVSDETLAAMRRFLAG